MMNSLHSGNIFDVLAFPSEGRFASPVNESVAGLDPTVATIRLLASIVESSGDAIVSTTTDGVVTSWNKAAEGLFIYTSGEMLGRSFTVCVPEDRKHEFWGIREVLAAGGRPDLETVRLRSDGSEVEVHLALWPIKDKRGRLTGASAVFRDITIQKRSAEKLRRSQGLFQQITESIGEVFWMSECASGSVSYVSPAFEKIWGVPCESLYADHSVWVNAIHPEDRERTLATYAEQLQGKTISKEYRIVRGDGSIRFIQGRTFPILDDNGDVVRIAGVAGDVTDSRTSAAALAQSECRFQRLADSGIIGIFDGDSSGQILRANGRYLDMLGYSQEDLECGRVRWDKNTAPGFDHVNRQVARELAAKGYTSPVEMDFLCKDGGRVSVLMGLAALGANTAVGFVLDLSERKLAEEELRRSEQKFRQFAENVRDVLWLMSTDTGEMLFVSPAYEDIWKRSREDIYRNPEAWLEAIHSDDREKAGEVFRRQLQGLCIDNEYRIVQPSGAIRWIRDRSFPIRDTHGKITRLGGVAEDITERKLHEKILQHQALHDPLTDLPNRRLLLKELDAAIRQQKEKGDILAVLYIDLDGFKLVNDSLGHTAGDRLLKEVTTRLREVTPTTATLARVGGDEFTLLAQGFADREEVKRLGQELLDSLRAPFKVDGSELFIGASIGISLFPGYGDNPDVLEQYADTAAQEAKRLGKGQLVFFSESFTEERHKRLAMETSLQRALLMGEFHLHYQPQFACDGIDPVRFEALIRWQPPGSAPIPPDDFIPLAEANGSIVAIGSWVLLEACRAAAGWQQGDLQGIGVAVNVSAQQFAGAGFVELVAAALCESGLSPGLLELEITETMFIAGLGDSLEKLERLKGLGISLALDDFGTGYSSLSYLRNLPINTIKIDRSFLIETGQKRSGEAVLRCVIDLAHVLGLRVIVEGVETTEQLNMLRSLGCDEVQGFLLGKPARDVTDFQRGKRSLLMLDSIGKTWTPPHVPVADSQELATCGTSAYSSVGRRQRCPGRARPSPSQR
jgi:diguanylate cyclase (GGDEF)-like protein/PAS domain S-box-containing protein